MDLFNQVAKAKPLLKEVLLIGGPADGCRMAVNLNKSTVKVIDDEEQSHQYRKITWEVGGTIILFIHSSVDDSNVMRMLISGYRNEN